MPPAEHDPNSIDPPPFLRTWPRVYAAVLIYLATLLVLLYTITRLFHY